MGREGRGRQRILEIEDRIVIRGRADRQRQARGRTEQRRGGGPGGQQALREQSRKRGGSRLRRQSQRQRRQGIVKRQRGSGIDRPKGRVVRHLAVSVVSGIPFSIDQGFCLREVP